ncbi:replication protein A 32 kDa subunit A-like [Prunus dulcis]|uniref:replication protein A 32 kDa subunit A-like n=1 Tax=Prunus dulcis TaxID=3755 RepID=UPI001481D822|nr:replication protein A 32 kDa subunit A-like [Prunus dulcis]
MLPLSGVKENFDSREMQEIEDGMYVRVNGHLKVFRGVRQIVAFSVRYGIKDVPFNFRQLLDRMHILCLLYLFMVYLHSLKLQGNSATQPESVDSSLSTPVRSGSSGYQTAPSNQFYGQVSVGGIKGCDQLVLDYLQQHSSIGKEKGIHRDELSQHLKVPVEKILEAIRSLEEEGLIYSTIDEFHYKSAAYFDFVLLRLERKVTYMNVVMYISLLISFYVHLDGFSTKVQTITFVLFNQKRYSSSQKIFWIEHSRKDNTACLAIEYEDPRLIKVASMYYLSL